MKLKQFYLALSVATVLSACSNEDNLPPEPVDAYISLSLSSQPTALRSATKAGETTDKEGTAGEKRITEVATLLFDNAGMLVAFKDTVLPPADLSKKDVTISEVNNIHVKVLPAAEGKASDTKFKMVVVANSNDLVRGVVSLDDLKKKETLDITNYTPEKVNGTPAATKYLPMISAVLDVSGIIPEKQNVVGVEGKVVTAASPIIVTRRVARVQLDQLTVNFTDKSYGSFTPDSFFVVNVRQKSLFMGESLEIATAPFMHGIKGFVPSQNLIDPKGTYSIDAFGMKANNTELTNSGKYSSTTSPIFQCYVYENLIGKKEVAPASKAGETVYDTRLIISGEVKLATGQSLGKRYFHIPLQNDANPPVKVTHNTIYKVNATISGEGSPKIDELLLNAWINYNIKVEDWNVINQDVTDIN